MIARADRGAVIRGLGRAALVPAAALAVHQLRFMLAFGGHSGAVLARQGHAYLHSWAPWIMLLIGVGVGGFLWALGRAVAGNRSATRYALSLVALWIVCAACLVAVYVTQEFMEGLFATGHPAGLAVAIGLVLAAIFHGARWVLDEVAERVAGVLVGRALRPPQTPRPHDAWLPRLLPLADGWSGRGPPS